MADLIRITDDFYVAPQLSVEEMDDVAAAGFDLVVFNRPDNEDDAMPAVSDLAARIEHHGIAFHHIPFIGGPEPEDIAAFVNVLRENSGEKILLFCRTGTRSTLLWVFAMVESKRLTMTEALAKAQSAGYDLREHVELILELAA
jgi:uncharacterized protein (TIGR01244 family)